MCTDQVTAITGDDELRCTERIRRVMCVYGACKLRGQRPARSPTTAPRGISTGRVEVNAMLCCKRERYRAKGDSSRNE